jgi:hypothetical protein
MEQIIAWALASASSRPQSRISTAARRFGGRLAITPSALRQTSQSLRVIFFNLSADQVLQGSTAGVNVLDPDGLADPGRKYQCCIRGARL